MTMTVKPEGTGNDIRHYVQPLDSYRSAPVLRMFCLDYSRRSEKVLRRKGMHTQGSGQQPRIILQGHEEDRCSCDSCDYWLLTCAWHAKTPCARYQPNLVLYCGSVRIRLFLGCNVSDEETREPQDCAQARIEMTAF